MRSTILMALVALSACSSAVDECAKASNPGECRAWADAGGDVQDYLIGGMAGYMLGSAMNGGRRETVIVRDPAYHGPARQLHRSLPDPRDQVIARQQRKIAAQRRELRRQQAAARQSRSSSSSSRSSWSSSRSSSRSSSSRRR